MAAAIVVVLALVAVGCGGGGGDPEPSSEEKQAIERIRRAGGDPEKPRRVDFYLYFPSQETAIAAADDLRSDGYPTIVARAADGDSGWLVLATRTIVLTGGDLRREQQRLDALARRHGGEYDGWNAPAEP